MPRGRLSSQRRKLPGMREAPWRGSKTAGHECASPLEWKLYVCAMMLWWCGGVQRWVECRDQSCCSGVAGVAKPSLAGGGRDSAASPAMRHPPNPMNTKGARVSRSRSMLPTWIFNAVWL